ncbi:MAG: methylenetetrahydrofolate reductase [Emcibacter sp.]|nr:methylenetetrahydrofolate reductase [Emcibacter sp.]
MIVENMIVSPEEIRAEMSKLLKDYSAEVTAPDRKSLDAAADMMDPGSRVYIASLPSDTADRLVSAASHLKKAGLVPVPHIVARNIKSEKALDELLARLAGEAGVDRALVLAGDRDDAAGDLDCSLQIIQTGLLEKHGISKIAIGTYPEGHPRISNEVLDVALKDKLAAAEKANLETVTISQVCFESKPILDHIRRLRAQGINNRIRIGVAGPAKKTTLLKYAMICGVGASMRALKERKSLMKNLATGETPEKVLTELAIAQLQEPSLNIWGIHFFTFAAFANSINFVAKFRD